MGHFIEQSAAQYERGLNNTVWEDVWATACSEGRTQSLQHIGVPAAEEDKLLFAIFGAACRGRYAQT